MGTEALKLVAARYSLGAAQSDELRQIADQALDSGVYSSSLAEMAGCSTPILSDIGPLFEAALEELAIILPGENDAIEILVRHHLKSVVHGSVRPRDGLERIMEDVYYPAKIHEKSKQFDGDSHGLEKLIGAYWSYDDVGEQLGREFLSGDHRDFDGFRDLDRDTIKFAKVWLSDHSSWPR